jgi:hypothetical protein
MVNPSSRRQLGSINTFFLKKETKTFVLESKLPGIWVSTAHHGLDIRTRTGLGLLKLDILILLKPDEG